MKLLSKIIDIPYKNFAVANLEKVEGQISQIKEKVVKIGRNYFFTQIKF